jgi:hypothetical protein
MRSERGPCLLSHYFWSRPENESVPGVRYRWMLVLSSGEQVREFVRIAKTAGERWRIWTSAKQSGTSVSSGTRVTGICANLSHRKKKSTVYQRIWQNRRS